jgi:short chain dehydrogenase/Multicopper oxidase
VLAINLTGVFLCIKYELPRMLETGGGSIVNVASILGLVGFANAPAYTAAKHGVVGLTKVAALEYSALGVRVNALCPGFIETPMVMERGVEAGAHPEVYEQIVTLHPMMGDMGGMDSGDILYPLYLVNGRPPEDSETLEVRRGERIRLRLMNPAAETIFRFAAAGHKLSVTHADGQPVEPVTVDAVRIGMGERYDVILEQTTPASGNSPPSPRARAVSPTRCSAMGRAARSQRHRQNFFRKSWAAGSSPTQTSRTPAGDHSRKTASSAARTARGS